MHDNYFLSQPHRPFFLLSIVNAVVFMGVFFLGYKGIVALSIPFEIWHPYSMIYGVFFSAFSGFLFTTFPRFNQTEEVLQIDHTNVFFLALVGSLLLFVGVLSSLIVTLGGMFLLLIAEVMMVYKLYKIYRFSQVREKQDSFWILIGNIFGILGHSLFIVSVFGLENVYTNAVNISVLLFIVFTAFSVAQKMVPFFSHSFAFKNLKFTPISFWLFFFASLSYSLGFLLVSAGVFFILSGYLLKEFLRWKLNPFASSAIIWVLHLALFWLPAGLFIWACLLIIEFLYGVSFYFAGEHLLVLGFLTTILIGFGTRVILGHSSGSVPHADRVSVSLFVLTQCIVLFRTLYSFDVAFGWEKPFFFDIAATLWLVLFVVWGVKFGKVLILHKG